MTGAAVAPTAATAAAIAGAVSAFVATQGLLLVVPDFDGTLAEYHPDPMGVSMARGVEPVLRRLARRAAADPERLAVVVLSGRAADDLAGRVRIGGIRYLGNHGNEGGALARGRPAESLEIALVPGLERFIPSTERLTAAVVAGLAAISGDPPAWLFVESKGPSVSFHYRGAADRDLARRQLDEAIDRAVAAGLADGYRRIDQRLIIEFQPDLAGAKGEALERLLGELRPEGILVLGDDVPDAEAFEVAHGAVGEGRVQAAMTVAISHGRPLDPALGGSADLVVAGTRGAASVLRVLAGALELEPLRGGPAG